MFKNIGIVIQNQLHEITNSDTQNIWTSQRNLISNFLMIIVYAFDSISADPNNNIVSNFGLRRIETDMILLGI